MNLMPSPQSLIVIGAGPGGHAAALEAARRKIAVTLVERSDIGGTCLNRGCIPSKFFLAKAKAGPGALPFDMTKLQETKNTIIGTLRQRMQQALKSGAVRAITGTARLVSDHSVEITAADGTVSTATADVLLLATGTEPVRPALFPNHPAILDSTSALALDHVPSHLVVVGGGYIGCELACAFQGLGSKVTLVEKESRLLPTQSEFESAATVLHHSFKKRGMTVWTGTMIDAVTPIDAHHLRLRCSNGETFDANAVLLALGRAAKSATLGLDQAGLPLDQGKLRVNAFMQTSVPSIYAIGDLVSPLPLAHVAAKEAETAVAHMCGEEHPLNYASMPRCVYTWPEAAAVGLTEAQARAAALSPRVDRYHFAASAKALIEEESEGMWVLVSDSATRKILGAQIVGPHATELIHLISLSLRAGLRVDDVAETVFAHPSLSEGFGEAMSRTVKSQTGSVKKQ